MIVRKFRLDNGWTQEQLAEITQLSVRTIQRMERGRKSSLESLQALAAAFDTDVSQLTQESTMEGKTISKEEEKAMVFHSLIEVSEGYF